VRIEVLMAMNVKIIVFWDVMPCSLIKFTNILVGPAAFIFVVKVEEWRGFFYSESGDSRFLKNTYHSTKLHSIISQKPIIFMFEILK
jgi:hypothetical protein